MSTLEALAGLAHPHGLVLRGAFHPVPEDTVPDLPGGAPAGTVVLLGFVGREGFDRFLASSEARDGLPDPLDRWSRLVVGCLAAASGGIPLFPFGGPPWLPFQRWARKAGPLHPSPLGLLIHPDYGLWHSFRGALALAGRLALPPPDTRPSPCERCQERPCLSACPVAAFTGQDYRVADCTAHLAGAGGECLERGCLARRACPVGQAHTHGEAQAGFAMRAFLRAQGPRPAVTQA